MLGGERLLAAVFLTVFSLAEGTSEADADLVSDLPGLTFELNFKHYSGYFSVPSGSKLHYWLVESQNKPESDPLILWLNGGPGCSSLGGLLKEHGPFHPNPDGVTLYENVFSWNKGANVLYLESPHGVGFSYRPSDTKGNDTYNDDDTAEENTDALIAFLKRFPEYNNRDFYVAGEDYGGVFVPTVTDRLIKMSKAGNLNVNLVGMAVGNGQLDKYQQLNSAIDLNYYRGIIGRTQFEKLKSCCSGSDGLPLSKCDFSRFIYFDERGIPHGKLNLTTYTDIECARNVLEYGFYDVWGTSDASKPKNDPFNTYQSCYAKAKSDGSDQGENFWTPKTSFKDLFSPSWYNYFIDQGALRNFQSTDNQGGFQCYMNEATRKYLQLKSIRDALHIPDDAPEWNECSQNVFTNFHQQNHDITGVFESIINSGYPLRVLIYNGDVDMASNFMGDQWFLEALAEKHNFTVTQEFTSWNFSLATDLVPFTGGYSKLFSYEKVKIDQLTVKGAGHLVPTDRPAHALQMITNFILQRNYSTTMPYDYELKPILEQYVPAKVSVSRKEADQVFELPGLTFDIGFNHYSGYLQTSNENFLHYWLFESQNNPIVDPLIVWLGGAPGCSNLGTILTENGPFHLNPDGKSLFENVYSWNKAANILYLEGPPDVGFSYWDKSNYTYNDGHVTEDAYLALKDFLNVYPEYLNRPFYVAGEGYGGVSVPMLTSMLIDKIQSGELKGLNLVGMAIGNGELSRVEQIKSAISLLYYHGVYGKQEWDQLRQCCNGTRSYQDLAMCDFSEYVSFDEHGKATSIGNSTCGDLVVELGQNGVSKNEQMQDVFNMYEDCYQQQSVLGSRSFASSNPNFNTISTDNEGGFQCYAISATNAWLNSLTVQHALHIPISVQDWQECNQDVAKQYTQQHNDTGPIFDHILASGYSLRVLIYNGDVDPVASFLGDQWFIENFAKRNSLSTSKSYSAWTYKEQAGGYWKRFSGGSLEVDLLTVKGAGHFVGTDRPGPSFQMINNFISHKDYGTDSRVLSNNPSPLNKEYKIMEWIAGSQLGKTHIVKDYLKHSGFVFKEEHREQTKTYGSEAKTYPNDKNSDKITDLPGLTFQPGFEQYSGFLDASNGTHLHYWLVESQNDPKQDPLILWLNGGPGCSSLGGLLTELGPFRPSADGQELLENPFAWNKFANVLFLESPRSVGFSYNEYDPQNTVVYNDDMTARDNLLAVKSFFDKFPEYQKRPFYIMGESFGGVYVPTLVRDLLHDIKKSNSANINFSGFAIGNGILSQYDQLNSAVDLLYYRGIYSEQDYKAVSSCCSLDNNSDPMYAAQPCDFTKYLWSVSGWDPTKATPKELQCSKLVSKLGFDLVWNTINDAYNTYQDCYIHASPENEDTKRRKREAYSYGGQTLSNKNPFVNQQESINYQSTDPFRGSSCYSKKGAQLYLNRKDVRKALHVDRTELDGVEWVQCSQTLAYDHTNNYLDMAPTFEEIFNFGLPLKMLIYNGDVDMVCQFLGDEWFIERLMGKLGVEGTKRTPWKYTLNSGNEKAPYLPRIGGYQKRFNLTEHNVILDQLTVKGSGHMVPMDRPGPALQMIHNFITSQDYSTMLPVIIPKPLLKEFVPPTPPPVDRRTADEIFNLPGLTFVPNFRQFSGYLKPKTPGVYLHYWFVESQNDPSTDPIILYFEGGPGGSSLTPMFTEVGPFFPNPDGQTFFENVFSWNKAHNVLFIEAPRGVGFSYQDTDVDKNCTQNDDMTSWDNLWAVVDFFDAHSLYNSANQNNEFYVGGLSYAGVYVPTLIQRMLHNKDQLNFNLKGMFTENGYVSAIQNIRYLPDYLYFHGMMPKNDWDFLKNCCNNADGLATAYCDYDQFVDIDGSGDAIPKTFDDPVKTECSNIIALYANGDWNSYYNDAYNLYQDCYDWTPDDNPLSFIQLPKSRRSRTRRLKRGRMAKKNFVNQPSRINYYSSDADMGFMCYTYEAASLDYLDWPEVRQALHIPDYVQSWSASPDCIGDYSQNVLDETDLYKDILSNAPENFKIMFYAGDVDTVCGLFENQLFVENLFNSYTPKNAHVVQEHRPWTYSLGEQFEPQIVGYQKSYQIGSTRIEFASLRGAGHTAAGDRPGPALQLVTNFVKFTLNSTTKNEPVPMSTLTGFSVERQPLKKQYQPFTNAPQGTIQPSTVSPTTHTLPTTISTSTTTTSTTNLKITITTKAAQMNKLLLVALLLGAAAAMSVAPKDATGMEITENANEDWETFKATYHKVYRNDQDENVHKKIFMQSRLFIRSFNGRGFSIGLNHFADMTPEDYEKMNGFRMNAEEGLLIEEKMIQPCII
ncbi:hypothetical protein QR680_011351 [Steinernema hermaphroditum]|uniref:Cathepsin propeptide inhibitor domain-containing protein n=1 Tax=Steinernema hermaphroditum TaxID=289476 RepID=A0AA39IUF6_9BILA|nr:hypothetical protein QR680_011351 [Steinernema hermaphroditum]